MDHGGAFQLIFEYLLMAPCVASLLPKGAYDGDPLSTFTIVVGAFNILIFFFDQQKKNFISKS